MAGEIDTAAKRAKLAPRKNPYWQGVSGGRGGLSLGYRRASIGAGSWIAKFVFERQRCEERIGAADDEPVGAGALSYASAVAAALEWGRRQALAIEACRTAASEAKIPTVRLAVEAYIEVRRSRSKKVGSEAMLKRYVLPDALASIRLGRLTAHTLEDWRTQLPTDLSPSSRNRILNDFRAALNAAATKYRSQIPAHIPAEIKVGTKAEPAIAAPRRQLLTDAQIRALVEAAFAVDDDGDFGRLVLLAAMTGARFSQLVALTVWDVQVENCRIMVPSSRKGKNRRLGERTAVPVAADVIEHLAAALAGRRGHETLLLRWGYRQGDGPFRWTKDKRHPWRRAYEVLELWGQAVKLVPGVPPNTVMYALRHSSIVRGLRLGLPVRLVAALHDTSVEMIEAHYSAFIVDMTEELARRAALNFLVPTQVVSEAAE